MFTIQNFNKAKGKLEELNHKRINIKDYRTNIKKILKQSNPADFAMEEAENQDIKEYLDACELLNTERHALRVFISKCEEHLNIELALKLIK